MSERCPLDIEGAPSRGTCGTCHLAETCYASLDDDAVAARLKAVGEQQWSSIQAAQAEAFPED